MMECDQAAGGGEHATGGERLAAGQRDRRIFGLAVHIHRPAERVGHDIRPAMVPPRTGLAESRDRGEDERWISRGKRLVAEPERVEPSGGERLDHEVGPHHQLVKALAIVGVFGIELDGALVGIREEMEHTPLGIRLAPDEGTDPTQRIPPATLGANHVRPHVGEQLAAIDARLVADLDDAERFERGRIGRGSLRCSSHSPHLCRLPSGNPSPKRAPATRPHRAPHALSMAAGPAPDCGDSM
jgi:hypothetical protein